MINISQHKQSLTAILAILLLGAIFHYRFINEFPSHTHAWAQSDRYALAHGFINNGLNFFKPESFVHNHQFPGNWKVPSKESITAVDFPIHDYIPAIFMKLLGDSSPWIFRLYILTYSFFGLFFLFRLAKLLTNDFYKSIFVIVFAATSPVFVYYQGGFLPTIPSLANAFIGIYFYAEYLLANRRKSFNLSVGFLTLAALSRTTFLIPLVAIFGLEFLRILRSKTQIKPILIPALISAGTILFYFVYNGFIRAKYGSIFLNHILPATSIQEIVEILGSIKERWLMQYFSNIHYLVLVIMFAISSIMVASGRIKIKRETLAILLLSSIIFSGCIAFTLLMLRQFPAHDYYFLDTFFLPIVLLLIVMLSTTPPTKGKKLTLISALAVFAIGTPMAMNAASSQDERRATGYWDRIAATINNFNNADKYLDAVNIPRDSKMLVIDAYPPNIPFLLMKRKGYAVSSTKRENIKNALAWDHDYIVLQNEFFLSDIYVAYPEILSKIKKIWDNGRISICQLTDVEIDQTLHEYLGLQNKSPVFEVMMNYDTTSNEFWHNTKATSDFYFSGRKSGVLSEEMTYGLTYKTKKLPAITDKSRTLLFSSYFSHDGINKCEIVVTINENGRNTYFKAYNLREILVNKGSWEKVDLTFQLPQVESEDYEFALFIWNTGKTELLIDDFGFKLY